MKMNTAKDETIENPSHNINNAINENNNKQNQNNFYEEKEDKISNIDNENANLKQKKDNKLTNTNEQNNEHLHPERADEFSYTDNQKENTSQISSRKETNSINKKKDSKQDLKSINTNSSDKHENLYIFTEQKKTDYNLQSKTQPNFKKKSPAYLYELEVQRTKAKQNQNKNLQLKTSQSQYKAFPSYNTTSAFGYTSITTSNNDIKRTSYIKGKESKILQSKHNKMIKQIYSKDILYSLYWPNKLLDKRYGCEIKTIGFLNGVPIINVKKKNPDKKIEQNTNEDNNDINNEMNNDEAQSKNKYNYFEDNDEDLSISSKNDKLFYTNQKNFFRNEIKEESEEEKEYNDNNSNENEEQIQNNKSNTKNDIANNDLHDIYKPKKINPSKNTRRITDCEKEIEFDEIFKAFSPKNSKKK